MTRPLYIRSLQNTIRVTFHKASIIDGFLFIALLSGPPKFRSRDPLASFSGQIDWSVMINISVWILAFLWIASNILDNIKNKRYLKRMNKEQKLTIIFGITLGFSIIVSPAIFLTTYRVFQLLVLFAFCWLWVNKYSYELVYKYLFIGNFLLSIIITFCALFFPELVFAGNRLIGGVVAGTGSVALISLILVNNYPYQIIKNKYCKISINLYLLILIGLSRTRSIYFGLIIYMVLALIFSKKDWGFIRNSYILIFIVLFLYVSGYSDDIYSWLVRDPNSIYTMSERIPLWKYTLNYLKESPWLGLGFATERSVSLLFNSGIGSAHSSYFAVLLGGGLIGISSFVITTVNICCKLIDKFIKKPILYKVWLYLFIVFLVIGVTSEELVVPSSSAFTFWIIPSIFSSLCVKE